MVSMAVLRKFLRKFRQPAESIILEARGAKLG
jgi:hypothetical protein